MPEKNHKVDDVQKDEVTTENYDSPEKFPQGLNFQELSKQIGPTEVWDQEGHQSL